MVEIGFGNEDMKIASSFTKKINENRLISLKNEN